MYFTYSYISSFQVAYLYRTLYQHIISVVFGIMKTEVDVWVGLTGVMVDISELAEMIMWLDGGKHAFSMSGI